MYWRDYLNNARCEFSEVRHPQARKDYTCDECGQAIPKGTEYMYLVGRWGYDFSVARTCLQCESDWQELLEAYANYGEYLGVIYGCFKKALQEALDLDYLEEDSELVQKWFPELAEFEDEVVYRNPNQNKLDLEA